MGNPCAAWFGSTQTTPSLVKAFSLPWPAHGRGDGASGKLEPVVLFAGTLPSGTSEYSFSIPVENAPLSYTGENFSVEWEVTVAADIPWALDPKETASFDVVRGDQGAPASFLRSGLMDVVPSPAMSKARLGCLAIFLLPFFILGLGALSIGIENLLNGADDGVSMVLFGAAFAIVPVLVALVISAKILGRRKVGDVDIELQTADAKPGDALRARIRITPPKDIQVNAITCTLHGEEVAIWRDSEGNRTTHRCDLHRQTHTVCGTRILDGRRPTQFDGDFRIPPDAVPSFQAGGNELVWKLVVDVDVPKWPDHRKEKKLLVN